MLAAMLGTSACAPVACTTIGYLHTLTVHVEGDAGEVDQLVLCQQGDCGQSFALVADRIGDADWHVDGMLDAEATVTIRVLDASGEILTDAQVSPAWPAAPQPCGGPLSGETVLEL